MIVVIFPKDDFDAAQVAFQLQMMLGPGRIFVIPKGWTDERGLEKIRQANLVLLIVTDRSVHIDEMTRRELEAAKILGKRIVVIAPKGKFRREGWYQLVEFEPGDRESFVNALEEVLRRGSPPRKKHPRTEEIKIPSSATAIIWIYYLALILILRHLNESNGT